MRVAIIAAVLCGLPAFATPGSLGDAARQQARKRVGEAPAARTYSDADLGYRGAPHDDEAAPPLVPTSEAAQRAQLDQEEKARRAQEERWRAVSREARAQIERAQSELDDCRLRGG